MLTTSKTHVKIMPVLWIVGVTMLLWLGSKWYYRDGFANPYKYPAKAASLTATVLMCVSIVLSTRIRAVEDYFGGMDKVYQVHKRLGRLSFFLILLHPLFLAADRLPDIVRFLGAMWFQRPAGERYLWGQNVGVAALLGFAALIAVTLWIKIPYHRWKRTHEWFGLVLLLVIVHILLVDADVARYPLLRLWMYAILLAAMAAFAYIRFLYRFLGPRFEYVVSEIVRLGDILDVTFAPKGRKMDFKPSQFVYLVIHKEGISPEPHPYSIACGYRLGARFKLGIKQAGDHTRTLNRLEEGDAVTVYGPYGHFSDKFLTAERDCVFIGGGIGITPFIGMWHVALHSEDRYDRNELPQPLTRLHPEIVRTWKSPLVSLFYVCRTLEEASFDKDIRAEVTNSEFHGFEEFERRGHHYELYVSGQQGRLTAEYVDRKVRGGVMDKGIFLCGPSAMTDALIVQFRAMGVDGRQIVVEDFNLV